MHFIYSVAALAATALAMPAQLVDNNAVVLSGKALLINEHGAQEVHKKRSPQRHMLPPIGTPTSYSTTSQSPTFFTKPNTATTTTKSSTTSSKPTTTSTTKSSTTTSKSTTTSTKPTTTSTTSSRTTTTATRSTSSSSTGTFPAGETPTGAPFPAALQQAAVDHHNLHRRNHSAPFVTWSSTLASSAQILAERCNFQHNTSIGGGGYGQNIAAGLKADNITASITALWYNSEFNAYLPSYYGNEPDMNKFSSFGHFTQVIWSTTTTIGCYVADCSNNPNKLQNVGSGVQPYLTVCNYGPPGNYVGDFAKHIGKPLGQPTAQWNTNL